MTLLEATGHYWRCSRILRGHSYGTPEIAENRLMSLESDSSLGASRLRELAAQNSLSRWQWPKDCKIISIA